MTKQIAAISIICLSMLFFCFGCSYIIAEPDSYMRPPKATGDQAGIQQELEKNAKGNKYILKYPGAGDYRSAIIMVDLTGNSTNEALIFYRFTDDSEGTRFLFLAQENNTWKVKGEYQGLGSEVDRVCFGDADGDGIKEIIIGWKMAPDEKKFTIHKFMPDQSQNQFISFEQTFSYTEFFIGPFTRNNHDDIITVFFDSDLKTPHAELLRCINQRINRSEPVELTSGVIEYVSAQAGQINESLFGVVLDGTLGTSKQLATELLYCDDEGNLIAPLWNPYEPTSNPTIRSTGVVSQDFNHDGFIDLPIMSTFPAPTISRGDEDAKQVSIVLGKKFTVKGDKYNLEQVIKMYVNQKESYYFLIPDTWVDTVAALENDELRTVTFYELDSPGVPGEVLLRIQVFASEDFLYKLNSESIQKIFENNGNTYTAYIGKNNGELSVSLVDVQHDLRPTS